MTTLSIALLGLSPKLTLLPGRMKPSKGRRIEYLVRIRVGSKSLVISSCIIIQSIYILPNIALSLGSPRLVTTYVFDSPWGLVCSDSILALIDLILLQLCFV